MNNQSTPFSTADFIALLCALAIGIAFLVMPWLSVLGVSMTGLKLLPEAQATIQNDISSLWLIPLAAGVGGLAALWGLLDASARRMTAVATCLAGIVGLVYYGIFFVNSQNSLDVTSFVGAGFWVALFASVGLVVQVFIPRPVSSVTVSAGQVSSYFSAGLIVIFIVLLVIFLVQNSDAYPINFLFFEWEMAGSIFILVNSLLGFAIGFLVGRMRSSEVRGSRKPAKETIEGSEV